MSKKYVTELIFSVSDKGAGINLQKLNEHMNHLKKGTYFLSIERLPSQTRTTQQNRALRLYCRQLAEDFNEAGLSVYKVLKPSVEISWTGELVLELIWRPMQKWLLRKNSTTELSKHMDIDEVYDHLNRHLAERFPGLPHRPFPSKDQL